jgi:arylsulfatase A-like enzyme
VESVDIAGTLPNLCGVPALETADGKDLSSILFGGANPVRDVAVTEFAWSKSIRKKSWRLVWYPPLMFEESYPEGFGQLYNLSDDPWEERNLFFEPEHQAKVRELELDLMAWLVTTSRATTTMAEPLPVSPQNYYRYHHRVNADWKIPADYIGRATNWNYL